MSFTAKHGKVPPRRKLLGTRVHGSTGPFTREEPMAASERRINVSLQFLLSMILTPVFLLGGSIGVWAGSQSGIAVQLGWRIENGDAVPNCDFG
jgi:hypothetical protein